MTLTDKQIQSIAHLSRLNLDDSEQVEYCDKLSTILDYVAQMNQVDTTGVAPMAHPLDINQPTRADVVTENNQSEIMLPIAPAVENGLYCVPKVID